VPLSSPRIHSNVSAPSFDEKKAAHLGHLIPVLFDDSFVVQAHPKHNKDMMAIMQKIITHLRIETNPSPSSYSSFAIMREIQRSINSSEKIYPILVAAAFTATKFYSFAPLPTAGRHEMGALQKSHSSKRQLTHPSFFFIFCLEKMV